MRRQINVSVYTHQHGTLGACHLTHCLFLSAHICARVRKVRQPYTHTHTKVSAYSLHTQVRHPDPQPSQALHREHLKSNSLSKLPPLAFHNAIILNLTLYLNFPPLAFHKAII